MDAPARNLTGLRLILPIVREVMEKADMEELKWRVYRVFCLGYPRPRPKLEAQRKSSPSSHLSKLGVFPKLVGVAM